MPEKRGWQVTKSPPLNPPLYVYIHRQHTIGLSICDVCNMPIAILINFLFIFSFFFFFLFLSFFLFCQFLKWKKNKIYFLVILFSILFKKFKFKFHHSTEGHTFSFWPCHIRYALLIINKFPVEVFLLMPLLHLPLETTNRFIHLRYFSTILISLYSFIMNIR